MPEIVLLEKPVFHQERCVFVFESLEEPIRAAIAGMIVIAKKNELKIAMMTVIAIAPTNSPAGPGINAIGAKASAVVTVDPNSGQNKCNTLLETAVLGGKPERRCPEVSSTITIALSISKPSAMIRPVTDI